MKNLTLYTSQYYLVLDSIKITTTYVRLDLIVWYILEIVIHTYYLSLMYRNVASSNMSRLEAHAGFFMLLMKGTFDSYVL